MKEFSAQVLRERFVLTPPEGEGEPIIALSNRAPLDLMDGKGRVIEKLIIRGHMLHTVVRMMGSLLNTFQRTGPLLNRTAPLDWDQIWDISAGPYERAYNPDLWIAVYHDGKLVYQHGPHHSFLDVVEQCDINGTGDYETSLRLAEDLFNRAGRRVDITCESTIAATFSIGKDHGRGALILRGAQRTTTFTYNGDLKDMPGKAVNPVYFVNAAAAFLEGIQLAYHIGAGNEKLRRNFFTPNSEEGLILSSARARLAESNAAIRTFENLHNVHYRPERPDFPLLVMDAEQITRRRLNDDLTAEVMIVLENEKRDGA